MDESSIPASSRESLRKPLGNSALYEIEIADRQTVLKVNDDLVRRAVRGVLQAEGYTGAEVSIALVDDAAIRILNRQYLDHDYDTDVLSFLLQDAPGQLEGEVIVSCQTAVRRAPEFAHDPIVELLLYVIHGTLHLTGYDDGTPEQREVMREQEQKHLAKLFVGHASSGHEALESDLAADHQEGTPDGEGSPFRERSRHNADRTSDREAGDGGSRS